MTFPYTNQQNAASTSWGTILPLYFRDCRCQRILRLHNIIVVLLALKWLEKNPFALMPFNLWYFNRFSSQQDCVQSNHAPCQPTERDSENRIINTQDPLKRRTLTIKLLQIIWQLSCREIGSTNIFSNSSLLCRNDHCIRTVQLIFLCEVDTSFKLNYIRYEAASDSLCLIGRVRQPLRSRQYSTLIYCP